MILRINTKDQKEVKVELKEQGKVVASMSKQNVYGSQVLLPLIVKLLKKLGTKETNNPRVSSYSTPRVEILIPRVEALKGIEVETGPGSFTGLRVGVSVANALSFTLNIPVNGKKIETDLVY